MVERLMVYLVALSETTNATIDKINAIITTGSICGPFRICFSEPPTTRGLGSLDILEVGGLILRLSIILILDSHFDCHYQMTATILMTH
jgi:hypothetical protein